MVILAERTITLWWYIYRVVSLITIFQERDHEWYTWLLLHWIMCWSSSDISWKNYNLMAIYLQSCLPYYYIEVLQILSERTITLCWYIYRVVPLLLYFRNETMNGTLDYCCTGLCVEVLQILAERTILYSDIFTELFPLLLYFRNETMNGTIVYCTTVLCVDVLQILAERTMHSL